MRPSNRQPNELRNIKITRDFMKYAEGSVLIEYGETKVVCTATFTPGVPRFLKGKGKGWITAEYGMLPRATHERTDREASKGKQTGRSQEIQRLIGRALRTVINLDKLGENTIQLDCDVIQADGGTRTAAITGSCVALADAITYAYREKKILENPLKNLVAAVSVGIYNGNPVLDLDYREDSVAHTDMNIIMNDHGEFVEIQGTAEARSFSRAELDQMLALAEEGITILLAKQKEALGL